MDTGSCQQRRRSLLRGSRLHMFGDTITALVAVVVWLPERGDGEYRARTVSVNASSTCLETIDEGADPSCVFDLGCALPSYILSLKSLKIGLADINRHNAPDEASSRLTSWRFQLVPRSPPASSFTGKKACPSPSVPCADVVAHFFLDFAPDLQQHISFDQQGHGQHQHTHNPESKSWFCN